MQIGASAWTAEALKLTMPASAFSRSTECHNQDKVSMGTIAARDCLRVLELTGQVAAALALAARPGPGTAPAARASRPWSGSPKRPWPDLAEWAPAIPFVEEDRPLDAALRDLCAGLRACRWNLYP